MSNQGAQDENSLFTDDGYHDQEDHHEHDDEESNVSDEHKPTQASASVKKPMSKNLKIAIGVSVGIAASAIFVFLNMKSQPAPQQRPAVVAQDMSDMTPAANVPAASSTLPNGLVVTPLPPEDGMGGRKPQVIATSGVSPAQVQSASSVPASAPSQQPFTGPQPQDAKSLQADVQSLQSGAAGNADEAKKIEALTARVDRIEAFLLKLSQEREAGAQNKKTVGHQFSHPAGEKTVKHAAQHTRAVVALSDAVSATDSSNKNSGSVASQPSAKATSATNKPKLACEYRGGINNRAWISCDGDMQSVRVGDALPAPYGAVTAIDDKAGNITTAGGVIE